MVLKRAVLVVCDGLRADMVSPELTPRICALSAQGRFFAQHRGVFPSTTRTTSASIATGCLPGRHGLEGNCVALDEGNGLVAMSVGPPQFRDRLYKATGQTLRVPTLAERLVGKGGSVVFSNVSPGAGIFQDPDGHGWMYHRVLAYGPGRKPVEESDELCISHDAAGDSAMTDRFIEEILAERQPALAVLWQCEPDHSQHSQPLGSPAHLQAIRSADENAGRVADALVEINDADTLLIIASDHGHETVGEIINLEGKLIEGGFKQSLASVDVVVASNGLSASIYVDDKIRPRVQAMAEYLQADRRIGDVFFGDQLADVGHRTDSALAIVVDGCHRDDANEYGVKGIANAFHDTVSGDVEPGLGQHGGLGPYEQHPFMLVCGMASQVGVVDQQKTSAVDIAPTILRHLDLPHHGMDGRALP